MDIKDLCGAVIVSVQAPDGHPMRDTHTLLHVAQACVAAGTPAIRCGGYGGLEDIHTLSQGISVPVFGLTKEGNTGVYITPSVESVRAVAQAGAQVVCADATFRPAADGSTLQERVAAAHEAGALFMADCATPEEVAEAYAAGADIASTTLAGYTEHRPATTGPDLACLREARNLVGPEPMLIAEGRYHHPHQVKQAFDLGASAVIVGTAITDPMWITQQFLSWDT
ncbi:putative N-acetylmannosamine-6-phosphate 2-epimerase [Corynebacterium poyangense]|uniref:N-acylglucosamine-6-phosphate 2-epimerase n=1 Tax=Corynebacterium poyangense TaxID=2684405 RepID=A0A7H0SL28_9CORY|nr:N-acetylmannosamine-6-phosphate 2-epimerase [Corynebacterium poyangense]MBZ8177340.1 putative N-acetylmannosamine-6-phosphate 2-epimerase [Corynebacterium poyangense]QNQ89253.1 putative N-acetylmannosamine-6-phosphate 2-epimerase [Corynebacterium poyangense]